MKKKAKTRKVVINKCFGGFGLSPQAVLWLYKNGMKEIASPVKEYFGDKDYSEDLNKWKEFKKNRKKQAALFLTVFSPDEKFVLSVRPEKRDNPLLIKCLKTLGKKAWGDFAELKVVSIPANIKWKIEEYDGIEWVAEEHRTWG